MIRIALVDDHPALRAGLEAVLRSEPGIEPVGAAASREEILPLLHRTRPDVVLLDYHLPGADGLTVCREIKQDLLAPRVLLYSAYASSELVISARLAGADGVLNKGVPAFELFDALRRVSRGERVGPPVTDDLIDRARGRLGGVQLQLFDRLLEDAAPQQLCDQFDLDARQLGLAVDALIVKLGVDVSATGA